MRDRRFLWMLAVLAAFALVAAACGDDDDASDATADDDDDRTEITLVQEGSRLAAIQEAGVLRCGVRDDLPGFSVIDAAGEHVGFDADFCRVIAAAILGDADAVSFVDLETAARFTALQSGEIDVLVRNTTWTAARDGAESATFLQTTFFDGQGMMVPADSEFTSVADMDGTTVCVASGTTTEANAANHYTRLGIELVELLSFDETSLIQEAFIQGRCDGWSSDVSQLAGFRSEFPDGPDAVRILDDIFSKEPLGPAVLDGNDDLAQAVQWAIFATIQAEEFGITSANIDDFADSDDPAIRTWLGTDEEGGTFNPELGLPTDFNAQVVRQVGNYGEIWDAHIEALGLDRALNSLWTEGGLMYAPPYR